MLTFDDPLPFHPQRVLVAGVSGSGKTTLARRIERLTGGPHVEIDSLYHGPGWTPRAEFLEDVQALVSRPRWTTEWQYREVRPILAARADLLVWLDLPYYRITFPRVVRRTVRRARSGEELWNGNIEPPLRTIFADRDHIIRWSMRTHRTYAAQVPQLEHHHPDLVIVRLRSPRQVEAWLAGALAVAVST